MGYLFHKDIVNGWDSSYNKTPDNNNGAYVCYFGGAYALNLDKDPLKIGWHRHAQLEKGIAKRDSNKLCE